MHITEAQKAYEKWVEEGQDFNYTNSYMWESCWRMALERAMNIADKHSGHRISLIIKRELLDEHDTFGL